VPTKFTIREYLTARGTSPFRLWLAGLDTPIRARIQARVLRIEAGNPGDHRAVGDGVREMRCDFGPGYRVYFAIAGSALVLLLLGGDKASQHADIRKARAYWVDYQEGTRRGKT
jgi:putative addiction module killer protein